MTKKKGTKADAGRIGGEASTPAKRRTARENGQLGGRPGDPAIKKLMKQRGVTRQRAWAILYGGKTK
jgi:hypothetical protein